LIIPRVIIVIASSLDGRIAFPGGGESHLGSEEDKKRMLNSYTWKDLLVDGAIVTVVLGIIFLIISIFL